MRSLILLTLCSGISVVFFVAVFSTRPMSSPSDPPTLQQAAPPKLAKAHQIKPSSSNSQRSDFRAKADDTLDRLPGETDLDLAGDNDPHAPPKAIFAAAGKLGEVRSALLNHPELYPQGLQFYESCARKESALISLRATCLRNYIDLSARLSQRVELSSFPQDIVELAERLPALPFR